MIDINALILLLVIRIIALASEVIKKLMVQGLLGSYPLVRVHFKQSFHQIDFDVIHYRCVSRLKGLWLSNVWELQTLVPSVATEFVLKEIWKMTKNFLDHEQLINF